MSSRRPSGPQGNLLLGSALELQRDVLGFMTRTAQQYGRVARFRVGPSAWYLVSHPDDIDRVLTTDAKKFRKWDVLHVMGRILFGNGLVTSEGEEWLRQRRLAAPAFHRQRLEEYGKVMVGAAERTTASWRSGETRELFGDFMRLTLGVACRTLFDADVASETDEIGRAVTIALEGYNGRAKAGIPMPDWLPVPQNLKMRWGAARIDRVVTRIVTERRNDARDRGDLLSMLIAAVDDRDGSRMTDRQLRDELVTLLIAGHETTAVTLTWAFYLLSQNPSAAARLREELGAVLGGRAPQFADLPKLRYAAAVIDETLRLYPPAYAIGRAALEDHEIGGFSIPRGATVLLSAWVVQRSAAYFPDPEAFLPERWLDGSTDALPRCAYFPFGAGPRICIGNSFAKMESVLVLATIANRFRVALVSGHRVEPLPELSLRLKHGLRCVVTSVS